MHRGYQAASRGAHNARYYDATSGRFTSADDVEDNASGMDPYAYVQGNPETLMDPTGHYVAFDGSAAGSSAPGNSSPITGSGIGNWFKSLFSWLGIGAAAVAASSMMSSDTEPQARNTLNYGSTAAPIAVSHSSPWDSDNLPWTYHPKPTYAATRATKPETIARAKSVALAACDGKNSCTDINLDLASSEALGGHTLRDHAILSSDAIAQKKRLTDGLFLGDNPGERSLMAQRAVYSVLALSGNITPKYEGAYITYYGVNVNYPVGYIYTNGVRSALPTSRVTVVISALTCSVFTAFPSR